MLFRWKKKLTHQKQMSEALVVSLVLSFSGGFQDAYTYIVRNHVFANAQTGNVVLMSTKFMQGDFGGGLRYLFPLIAFALGVFIAENIQYYFREARVIHWRQGILIGEIAILAIVGFIPEKHNTIANFLVSLACALQVQSFRTVGGNSYASTMCIGNLRSGTAALSSWLRHRDRLDVERMSHYFGVILVFAIGAGIGGNLSAMLGKRTIWVSCAVLVIAYILMDMDRPPKEG